MKLGSPHVPSCSESQNRADFPAPGRQCCWGAGPLPGGRGLSQPLQAAPSLRGKKTLGCTCHSCSTEAIPTSPQGRRVSEGSKEARNATQLPPHGENMRRRQGSPLLVFLHCGHITPSAPQAPLHPPKGPLNTVFLFGMLFPSSVAWLTLADSSAFSAQLEHRVLRQGLSASSLPPQDQCLAPLSFIGCVIVVILRGVCECDCSVNIYLHILVHELLVGFMVP